MHRKPQPQPQGLEEMAGILSAGQADTVAPLDSTRRCLLWPHSMCRIYAFQILQTLMSLPGILKVRCGQRVFLFLGSLITFPRFSRVPFPALEDEGDEEEADQSSNRGKDGASGFKPGNSPVLAEGKVRRAKGSKASYVRCARPRLKDGGSSKQPGRSSQAAFLFGGLPTSSYGA